MKFAKTTLVLFLSMTCALHSPAAQAQSPVIGAMPPAQDSASPRKVQYLSEVDKFISKHSQNKFAYELSNDEFIEAMSSDGVSEAYRQQIEKLSEKMSSGSTSLENNEYEIREAEIRAEAFAIVDEMFKVYSVEQINFTLLSLLNDYLFKNEARGPITYLLDAIQNYNFSPEQMERIQTEANKLKQFTDGSIATIFVLSAASIIGYFRRGRVATQADVAPGLRALWNRLVGKKSNAGTLAKTTSATNAAATSQHSLENKSLLELKQMLDEATQSARHSSKLQTPNATLQQMAKMNKEKFYSKLSMLGDHPSFYNFAFIFGATAVGGAANIGYNALNRAIFAEDIRHSFINTNQFTAKPQASDLRSDYYDGLAVLNLTCSALYIKKGAEELLRKDPATSANSSQMQFLLMKELNSLYVEYSLLKRLAPRYMSTVPLPREGQGPTAQGISFNSESDMVELNLNVMNYALHEEMRCEGLKTTLGNENLTSSSAIEVNLGEALMILTDTFLILKSVDAQTAEVTNTVK